MYNKRDGGLFELVGSFFFGSIYSSVDRMWMPLAHAQTNLKFCAIHRARISKTGFLVCARARACIFYIIYIKYILETSGGSIPVKMFVLRRRRRRCTRGSKKKKNKMNETIQMRFYDDDIRLRTDEKWVPAERARSRTLYINLWDGTRAAQCPGQI